MDVWIVALVVALGGAVGGLVNAYLSDNGFLLSKTEIVDGRRIIRPGALGNVFIGAVAAALSWALYGPLGDVTVVGPRDPNVVVTLSLAALAGAVLIGVGGARWLTNEVDKRLLTAAASVAAAGKADVSAATRIEGARPAEALKIARSMTPATAPIDGPDG